MRPNAPLRKSSRFAFDAATAALQSATSTFTAAKASWDNLVNTRANVSGVLPYASSTKKAALDAAVATEVTGAAADAQAQVAVIEQANRQYVESNALAEGVDGAVNKTNLITNPNADENADGWSGGFGRLSSEQYTQGDGTSGGGYFDKNGASSYTAEQTISNLERGKYLLTITGRAQSGITDYYVKATNSFGESQTQALAVVGNQGGVFGRGFNDASVVFEQTLTGDATIGITASSDGNFWLSFDRVRLVKIGEAESELPTYTIVEGKMNAEVAQAQTDAETAFSSESTKANYDALLEAIDAAQASKNAYAYMTAAITKIDAALAAATTATESTDAYDAIKAAYTAGSIADAEIMTQVAAAYDAVIPVIKSQTAAQADFTLAIQNQSFEYGNTTGWETVASVDTGARSTSNDTYATTGSDGYYLFNTWSKGTPISQTIEDLPNGQYTMTVSVASSGATIYLLAQGEHDSYVETYETTNAEEAQYSSDTFQDASVTFLVKNGTATIGAVGGAGGEAGVHKDYVEDGYWWYKADNFRLVKNRDLTSEEEFVAATDEDYAFLNGTLEKYTLGFDAGDFAPYNNFALVQAIAAAKAIDQTAVNSKESVQAAAEAITSAGGIANETEVNAIYDGTFAAATNDGAPAGWSTTHSAGLGGAYHARAFVLTSGMSNYENLAAFGQGDGTRSAFYIRFDGTNSAQGTWYNYGGTNGYTMPLKANTKYKVTLQAGAWGDYANKNLSVTVKDASGTSVLSENITTTKKTSNGQGVDDGSFIFTTNEAGDYTFSLWNGNGANNYAAIVSNIILVKATAADLKEALLAEITTANAVDVTTNVGDGVFQKPTSAATALTTAISDALAVYDNADATIDQVIAATESVKIAVETYNNVELNAPDESTRYNILVATDDHAKKGNAIIVLPGKTVANNPTGYALNANYAPNANLASQNFTFTKVDGNNYTISLKLGEDWVYLTNGAKNGSAADWKASQIQATTELLRRKVLSTSTILRQTALLLVSQLVTSTLSLEMLISACLLPRIPLSPSTPPLLAGVL